MDGPEGDGGGATVLLETVQVPDGRKHMVRELSAAVSLPVPDQLTQLIMGHPDEE